MVTKPLSTRMQLVMSRANSYCSDCKDGHIGTDHLLVALFDEPDTIAFQALRFLGLTRAQIRSAIKNVSK
jgi:ATP-dependent Clp protease ATP-binding subunit ClpA